LDRGVERQSRHTDITGLVSSYLSPRHCADRGDGCAIAALGADIAREDNAVRRTLTTHIRSQFERIAQLLKGGTAAQRRKRAIATLAGMVGAMTLARAVDDPTLSNEILAAARGLFGAPPTS
jgi:TetR/AcrR family transcriptional repressor of nem operon